MLRPTIRVLFYVGLALPVALSLTLGLKLLLEAMGDDAGGAFFGRLAQLEGLVWVANLVCLVLVLAAGNLREPGRGDSDRGSDSS